MVNENLTNGALILLCSCVDPVGGGGGGGGGVQGVQTPPPPEKSQNIGFLSNTGPDPLKNHKATQPVFNDGPSSAHQGNTILMKAHLKWYLDLPSPHQKKQKQKNVKVGPPLTDKTPWIRTWCCCCCFF